MDHKFDKIRNALTPGTPLSADKDALWNDIERSLDKDKKQRRPLVFIMIFIGLGLTAAGILMVMQKNGKVEQRQETVVNRHDASLQDERKSTVHRQEPQTKTSYGSKMDTGSVKVAKNTVVKGSHSSKDISKTKSQSNTPLVTNPAHHRQSHYMSGTDHLGTKHAPILSKRETSADENHKHAASLNAPLPQDLTYMDAGSNTRMKSEVQNAAPWYIVAPIDRLENSNLASIQKNKVALAMSHLPDPEHELVPKKSWEWQLSSGIHIWNKYDQTYSPALQTVSDRRNTISAPKESLTAAVMIKREIFSDCYVGLGLQYNQLTEVIAAEDILVTNQEVTSDSAFYYVGASSVDYFKGKRRQTHRNGYLIYSPNYIKRWNIPLEMSYRYAIGRLHVVPSVSLLYNVSQRYEGIHMGLDGNFIYKDQAAFANIYKTSGLMSWAWAIDAEWSLSKRCAIRLGLVNQNDIHSVLREDSMLSEKYRQLGLNVGMKVKM